MTTTVRDLPPELVEEEILSRVPARHLKRLRSTCKRWNLLFNQERFARQHSVKAPKEVKALMLTADKRVHPVSHNLHGNGSVPSLEVKSELSLIDPSSGAQFDLSRVIHCDGFLVCPSRSQSRVVIWNPCTGQTRWIKSGSCINSLDTYVMGYTKSSSTKTYKVLCFPPCTGDLPRIYDFSSDSWRILDQGLSRAFCPHTVSVKGKAYWISSPGELASTYLARFDFDSEKASLLVPLPWQPCVFATLSLSAVGDDKLSILLQPYHYLTTFRTEVWVTNKILDDTTHVSWSLVFALDLNFDLHVLISNSANFLLDQDKKLALCCERQYDPEDNDDKEHNMDMDKVYCVGEDFDVTQVYSSLDSMDSYPPAILSYVPSLAHIEPVDGGNKRRRIRYSTT